MSGVEGMGSRAGVRDRVPYYDFLIWVVVKIRVPFWGTLNIRCRNIIGTPKGTIILTTTHVGVRPPSPASHPPLAGPSVAKLAYIPRT